MSNDEYLSRLHYLQDMKPHELLQELLATVHQDNGAYASEKGLAKAVLDAEIRWWHAFRAGLIGPSKVVSGPKIESPNAPASDSVSGG